MCCFEEGEPKENLCAECLTKYEEFNKYSKRQLIILLKAERLFRCKHERPQRKVICQLTKYHQGSHEAVIYWEDE